MSGRVIERCSDDLPLQSGEVRVGIPCCNETVRADAPDISLIGNFDDEPRIGVKFVFHGYSAAPSAFVFLRHRVHLMPEREVRVRLRMLS
jgi:hypothetical protein